MNEAVSLTFIFQTIGAILVVSAVAVLQIKIKTNKLKNNKDI